ncbi:hypothetical protein FSP39_022834 [Pinctada imbricata]|uniref:Uncharacterized protein n=1 Tax=Pinctada imbricata TaxID=66713 RepID=A0AA89CBJ2_PINIB|nr:hypothetical protein FSP39_022834 [Pinctada imbricata]
MQIVTDLIYNRNKSQQRVSERDGASESVRRPILFKESWSSTILLNRRHRRASWLSVNLALGPKRSLRTRTPLHELATTVGAPRDNFTDIPDIVRPGNIWKCPIRIAGRNRTDDCQTIRIRSAENSTTPRVPGIYEQTEQNLGSSILIAKRSIVVCAPLWKNLAFYDVQKIYKAVGRCYQIQKDDFTKVTPRDIDTGNDISALFGFSMATTSNPVFSVVIGSPDSVMGRGYAIESGMFGERPPRKPYVIVGSPGYTDSNGPVGAITLLEVGNLRLNQKKQFTGRQIGSGFGQIVLVADINGDANDDVIVGAPLTTGPNGAFEAGAFYVYYGHKGTYLTPDDREFRGASEEGARFGQSLASPGDINADNLNDLAIGAPYEDNGRGAIYIFNGADRLLPSKYSQKIMAADIDAGLRAFGFYISRSTLDIDDNTYNDFAVGAYQSDHTVILRSRPIIVLTTRFTVPPNVPLNSTNQECSTGNTSLPCVTLNLCFSFTGKGLSEGLMIDYWIQADTNKTNKRQPSRVDLILNNENMGYMFGRGELSISKTNETCENIHARVATLNRYFFQSIAERLVFSINFELSNISDGLAPLLANDVKKQATLDTKFDTGCSNICKSNLNIDMSMDSEEIILGETKEINARITISNSGEPAYAASVIIQPSESTAFRGFDQDLSTSDLKVSCSKKLNMTYIRCDFQTPILSDVEGIFSLRFDVSKERLLPKMTNVTDFNRVVQFNATVRDNAESAKDQDESDNFASQSSDVILRSDIIISGITNPEQAKFSANKQGFIAFSQRYTVDNNGPSPSPGAIISIDVPVRSTETMKYLTTRNAIKIKTFSDTDYCRLVAFPDQQTQSNAIIPSVRVRREVISETPKAAKLTKDEKYQDVACSRVKEKEEEYQQEYDCARIECSVMFLEYKQFRSIEISLNLSESALPGVLKESTFVRYFTEASVSKHTEWSIQYEQLRNSTAFASIDIFPVVVEKLPEPLNIWIIIGGSLGALLFLIIVFIILWRCGFFNRKKRDQLTDYKRKTMLQLRQTRMSMRGTPSALPAEQEKMLKIDAVD